MKFVETLSGFIVQPWFNKGHFVNFRRDVGTLVGSVKKMCEYLDKVNYIEKKNHDKPRQLRQVESNTEITIREKSLKKIHSAYLDLNERVKKLHEYEPLHLLQFEPEQRYERRHWIDDLQLSETVAVMKRHHGGTLGNILLMTQIFRSYKTTFSFATYLHVLQSCW